MADQDDYKDTKEVVEKMLERFGEIAKELWGWDETNPVFFDNNDIFLEDAYAAAYMEIMKVVVEMHIPPKPFGLSFTGEGGGEA
jgi:hypothetical protein